MKKRSIDKIFLPDEEIFIIDTSVLSPCYNLIYPRTKNKELCIRSKKLERIAMNLSRLDNWFTIPEVVQEFIYPNEYFNALKKQMKRPFLINYHCRKPFSRTQKKHRNFLLKKGLKERYKKTRKTITALQKQIKKTQNLLLEHAFSPEDIFTETCFEEYEKTLPRIERLHKYFHQTINGLNTDCKLITTAIIFGLENPISVYSRDRGLLKTYTEYILQNHFHIKNNFSIIDDKLGEKIPCMESYCLLTRKNFDDNTFLASASR